MTDSGVNSGDSLTSYSTEIDSRIGQHINSQELTFFWSGNTITYIKLRSTNFLLTLITLGIYSPWAKVRTKRFFLGNTSLLDSTFDFDANPFSILKARLVIFFVITSFILYDVYTDSNSTGIFFILLLILLPFLIVRSHVFNARHTIWRNVRFRFEKKYSSYLFHFYLMTAPILTLFYLFGYVRQEDHDWFAPTVGLLLGYVAITFPVSQWWKHSILINQLSFGNLKFRFLTQLSRYVIIYVTHLLLLAIAWVIFLLGPLFVILSVLGAVIINLVLLSLYAHFTHAYWNGVHTTEHSKITANFNPLQYAIKILFVNQLIVIFSLGLLIPVAIIRSRRFITNHLTFHPSDKLRVVLTNANKTENALTEEIVDAVGMDFDY